MARTAQANWISAMPEDEEECTDYGRPCHPDDLCKCAI